MILDERGRRSVPGSQRFPGKNFAGRRTIGVLETADGVPVADRSLLQGAF